MIKAGNTRRGPMALRVGNSRPSWVPADATVWADFVNNRFFWNGGVRDIASISVNRITGAWEFDVDGFSIISIASTQARRYFQSGVLDGIWVNSARTNQFRNSTSPANQTITLPTGQFCLWGLSEEIGNSLVISAGTGVATNLGSVDTAVNINSVYSLGLFRQFNVTTSGTFGINVIGAVAFAQCERQDSGGSFPCHPGPPIVTGSSAVAVSSDNLRITGLSGLSSDSSAYLFTGRQLGRANFPRLVSSGRTTFETAGSSAQQLLASDNITHYAAVMSLFPNTPLNNVFRISAALQTGAGNSRLVYNGAQFGTSGAYTGVVDTYDTLGLGNAPNFVGANYCGVIRTIGAWNFAQTTSNLIAAGG